MSDNSVSQANEGNTAVRQTFNINWGTFVTLGLPIAISGFIAYRDLQQQVATMDTRAKIGIEVSDKFQAETKAQLANVADLPLRMKAVEEQQKFLNDRLDRITDLVRNGQDQFRSDLAAAIEPVRKDVAAVSTKLEVLADRVGPRKGDRISASPGVYRPR